MDKIVQGLTIVISVTVAILLANQIQKMIG